MFGFFPSFKNCLLCLLVLSLYNISVCLMTKQVTNKQKNKKSGGGQILHTTVQETTYQNISLQNNPGYLFKIYKSRSNFSDISPFLCLCILHSVFLLISSASEANHKRKMGMCAVIKLCPVVEFRLTSNEMGERQEELVITVRRVQAVPCPLPLSHIRF